MGSEQWEEMYSYLYASADRNNLPFACLLNAWMSMSWVLIDAGCLPILLFLWSRTIRAA